MALSDQTHWEVRPQTGAGANGGGFNWSNTNFATDGAATSATGNSPVFSSVSYTFVAGDVGARVFIAKGSNWLPGFYKISSVSAGAATIDASVGAADSTQADNGYDGTRSWLGQSTVAGCATTASPSGATWGVDYSQQDSPLFSFTDLVIDAVTNTKFTSAAHPVGKNFIGNILNVTSGTGFTVQRVEIVSTSTTVATCDSALGTTSSTGGNAALGGALASIATVYGLGNINRNTIWATGTESRTSSVTSVSSVHYVRLRGYGTRRGDRTKFIVKATGSLTDLFNIDAYSLSRVENVEFDGNALASHLMTFAAISNNPEGWGGFYRCRFHGSTAYGLDLQYAATNFDDCEIDHNGTGTSDFGIKVTGTLRRCFIHHNTGPGQGSGYSGQTLIDCIYSYNGTTGADVPSNNADITRCVFANNGSHGLQFYGNGDLWQRLEDCIMYGNGGYGFNCNALGGVGNPLTINVARNMAMGGNSSGRGVFTEETNPIVLTVDPFVNAAAGNFALNTTTGGGALCRAAGSQVWGGTGSGNLVVTTGRDVGAMQHTDPVYVDFNDTGANDQLTQISTNFPAGSILEIRTGTSPGANNAATGTLLVSITLPTAPWGTSSASAMVLQNSWAAAAVATGTAGYARLKNAAGTKIMDLTMSASGGTGQLTIDVIAVVSGSTITVASGTLTQP